MDTNYPEKPIYNDGMKFKMGVIHAVKEFKRNCPYSVGDDLRYAGMVKLIAELNRLYNMHTVLTWDRTPAEHSYTSNYTPGLDVIRMEGKLSIITLLHEYAHARGMGEKGAVNWSLSLFKRCYPIAFANLDTFQHCLI